MAVLLLLVTCHDDGDGGGGVAQEAPECEAEQADESEERSSSERDHRTYPEPAVPLLACRQFTPEPSDPLTQPAQAAPAGQVVFRTCQKRYRSGIVDHLNLDVTAPVNDPDRGRLPGTVLDGVGQAFPALPGTLLDGVPPSPIRSAARFGVALAWLRRRVDYA